MKFVQLIEALAARGLSVVRGEGDRLRCEGDPSQLTPDLQAALSAHREQFLSLLPSNADRCQRIVSDAIDDANRMCPWGRRLSEDAFQAMDECQDMLHDCARLGDVEGAVEAAEQYLRVVRCCCVTDEIHEWADATPPYDAAIQRHHIAKPLVAGPTPASRPPHTDR
ncbi:MAG: hypothetical protein AB7I48_20780 [Planctomycetaceae bacterium]